MNQEKQNKKVNVFMILTIVFALAAVGLFVWQMNTEKELTGLLEEKEAQIVELQAELDNVIAEHNQTKQEFGQITDSLAAKDQVILENAKEIEKLLNTKWQYYKIKKKLEKLQDIAQGYVRQLDSIKVVNEQLYAENSMIKGQFEAEQMKTSELTKIKNELTDKVTEAAILKTFAVKASGVRARSGGREKVTEKARRVDKIKVSFVLGENTIAKAGLRNFYVRIAQPDNSILAKGRGDEYSFTHKGETLQYSIMKEVDYQKEVIEVVCYWDRKITQELAKGDYKVEVYDGDNVIGHANFNLR